MAESQAGSSPPASSASPASAVDVSDPRVAAAIDEYWRTNVSIMLVLLTIWALVGLGCGVIWADALNEWDLPGTGFPLGFWFAQQGSIATFIVLILVYALMMNRLDRKHREALRRIAADKANARAVSAQPAAAEPSDGGGAS